MVDYSKPFPCGECGKMVMANERHTFEDCKRWRKVIAKRKSKEEVFKRKNGK